MYTKQYFIDKFSKLEEHEVGFGDLNKHCALYHCGVTADRCGNYKMTDEAYALGDLLIPIADNTKHQCAVYHVNDGVGYLSDLGNTPKQRILNALNKIKD